MRCPRCEHGELQELDRDGITIDRCPTCRGLWLDRGELEKLLAREQAELEGAGVRRAPGEPAALDARDPRGPLDDRDGRDRRRGDWDDDDDDDDRRYGRYDGRYGDPRHRKRGLFHTLKELID